MTFPHHDAAERDQRRGRETVFFGTQQCSNHDITTGFQSAVGLQHNATAEIVQDQHLMRLSDAQFPRKPSVFDTGQRRSTRSAGVAGNQNVIGKRFGDALAITPTPTSETNFTLIRALRFAFFRS